MPRKPNIKWRKSDAEKLETEIKRFNKKIYNTRQRHPELKDILPKTITKADKLQMINEFKNAPRSEFKKTLNSLNRFLRPGAEQAVKSMTGNTVTKWEKREIGLKVGQINRQRTIERAKMENLDATSQGKPLGLKRGQMGSERMNALKPKKYNFDKIKGGKEWEKFKDTIEKQASYNYMNDKLEQYKANYLKGLDDVFGEYAKDIKAIIEKLPPELVNETYFKEQEASISFIYDMQEMNIKLDILSNIWGNVSEQYNNEING